MRRTESQKIALGGVLAALSIVVLLVGNILQIGTYAAPMLACFLLIPVLEEYGAKYALLLYAAVSILAIILVPEKELVLFYVLVLGYYPVLKGRLDSLRPALLRWCVKAAVFNGTVVILYTVLFWLLAPGLAAEFFADGPLYLVLLLALGNLSFWLCDKAIGQITIAYHLRLRQKIKKLF